MIGAFTDPTFDYPSTIVKVKGRLLVVNSQLDKRDRGIPPTFPFTISNVLCDDSPSSSHCSLL